MFEIPFILHQRENIFFNDQREKIFNLGLLEVFII